MTRNTASFKSGNEHAIKLRRHLLFMHHRTILIPVIIPHHCTHYTETHSVVNDGYSFTDSRIYQCVTIRDGKVTF